MPCFEVLKPHRRVVRLDQHHHDRGRGHDHHRGIHLDHGAHLVRDLGGCHLRYGDPFAAPGGIRRWDQQGQWSDLLASDRIIWSKQSTYLRVVISPRVGVGNASGSSSIGLNSLGRLHIDPLLRSGQIVTRVPMAFGDSISSVISNTGVGQAVGGGRRLSDNGSGGVASLNLGSGSVRNSGIGSNFLNVLSVTLSRLGLVKVSLVLLSEGLDLGD